MLFRSPLGPPGVPATIGPGLNPDGTMTGLFITAPFSPLNERSILRSMAILFNGAPREPLMSHAVYAFLDNFRKTTGRAPPGLYCYAFGLHTSDLPYGPCGAVDMANVARVELALTMLSPPIDPLARTFAVCDPETGQTVAVNRQHWRIHEYQYSFVLLEERYNFLRIHDGTVGLQYAN